MEIIEPDKDLKRIFLLYLEKFDKMTDDEREAFCTYLQCVSKLMWISKKEFSVNIKGE